jgi:MFS transporter, DHA2 family, multidrug resistance protein
MQQVESYKSSLFLNDSSAHALFNPVVDTQSAMLGLNDIFFLSSIIFVVIVPLIWITRPSQGAGSSDAAGAH